MIILFEFQKLFRQTRIKSIFLIFILLFVGVFTFQQMNDENTFVKNHALYTKEIEYMNSINDKKKIEYVDDKMTFYETLINYNQMYNKSIIVGSEEEIDIFDEEIVSYYKKTDMEEIRSLNVFYTALNDYIKNTILYNEYLAQVQKGIENIRDGISWNMYSEARKNYFDEMEVAYTALQSESLPLSNTLSFEQFSKSNIDIFFVVTLALLITILVFQLDDKNEMNQLLLTTKKGGYTSALAKLVVILITSIAMTLSFFVLKYSICHIVYGAFHWQHPIQSTSFFHESAYNLNVGQILLLYIGLLCLFVVSMQLVLVSLFKFFRIKMVSLLIIILLFLMSAISFYTIDSNSKFVLWKYLNLFLGFQITNLYSAFNSVAIFNQILSLPTLFTWIFMVLSGVSLVIFIVFCNTSMKTLTLHNPVDKITYKMYKHTSIYLHEMQKLLFNGKTILIIILFIGLGCWIQTSSFDGVETLIYENEEYAFEMFNTYGGKMDGEKQKVIESKNQSIDDLQLKMEQAKFEYDMKRITIEDYQKVVDEYQSSLKEGAMFKIVYNQYTLNPEYVVYAKGYHSIFGMNTEYRDIRNAIFVSIFLVLSFYAIYTMDQEKDEEMLYVVSKNGIQKRLHKKVLVLFTLIPIYLLYYLVEFFQFQSLYPMNHWDFPLAALANENVSYMFPLSENVPIGVYFICLWGIRLFAVVSITLFVLYISKKSKKRIVSFLVSFLIVLVPGLLSFTGLHFLSAISLLHLLMGNSVLQSNMTVIVIYLILDTILVRKLWKSA